ncbi:hydroxymethylglutaryl-CoA synthase [Jatrophihabitans endophyticus]|uniref:Hydroxymethylglutaryl-CoA synthase n=1 Tax=Jatrophihabitans endophyticus TaxID=1206085 RepID=A0A1M5I6Z7_9ACTN|nr:hydroxymethylglutaryl-CoA synthase [Jatrophihabitans endophyticus]SHG23700.1 hydroxymethylglutaryl-CoA synthase [Jatrophihabitans endophyticus]
MNPPAVGIEALDVYCGIARIGVAELFAGRGLDTDRQQNLMMTEKSVGLPCEDPVTNAVNAARPLVDALAPEERDRIEVLVTSTESGVDFSKSLASYVHEHLGLSRRCRLVEVKQACYGATAAVQLATGYLASGISPDAKILVVATDVPLVDEHAEYTEPAMGFGAAAVLLGTRPRILTMDLGAFGTHSYETLDSARPGPTFDIADSDRSLFAYLDCLANSFRGYRDRVEGADFAATFDYLAMHTPFAGMVRAAHRKMMRDFARDADQEEDFERRLAPALRYPSRVGNLCSGSVYLALASVIDNAAVDDGARVGLYSYGSGCSSEFFSGVVDGTSRTTLAAQGIGAALDARVEVPFDDYVDLLARSRDCLVPERDRSVDPDEYARWYDARGATRDLLVWTGTKDYHRTYDWITSRGATT